MVQDMPNKSFERSMNHNYMILSKCDFFGSNETKGEDYRLKMLLENDIAGLIPITHRMVNGESKYYYWRSCQRAQISARVPRLIS